MTNLYDIILYPDAVLKQTAHEIGAITPDIQAQANRMLHTVVSSSNSVGLAANQVGLLNRVMIAEVNPEGWKYDDPQKQIPEVLGSGKERHGNPMIMINPELVKKSGRRSICMEWCMSLPEQFAYVERHADVTVQFLDIDGNKHSLDVSGFDSHVVQHELDHLNGVLFIDYLSRLKRGSLVRKLEKYKKSEGLL